MTDLPRDRRAASPLVRAAAALVLSVAVAAAARAGDERSPSDLRLDAIVEKAGADATAALDEASAFLDAEPGNARAWNVRGWIHLERGTLDAAEKDFDAALAIDAGYAPALFNRGIVCVRRKDDAGARGWFDRALASEPDHVRALIERGRIHREADRFAEARKDLERAARVAPKDVHAWQNLGWLEQKESRWADAVRNYRRALALQPDDVWSISARARCLAELGHFDAALDDLAAAAKSGKPFDFDVARRAEAVARDVGLLPERGLRLRRLEAEHHRGLAFREPVALATTTRDAAGAATTSGMDDDEGSERRRARTKGLARLGLVKETTDVGAARAEARRAQIAGYYDPRTKQIFVVGGDEAELNRPAVVHELVHALQDQHFDLIGYRKRSLARRTPGVADEDLELATRMLTEGDATFAQSMLEMGDRQVGPQAERAAVRMAAKLVGVQDPVVIVRTTMRMAVATAKLTKADLDRIERLEPYALVAEVGPYLHGLALVEAAHTKGGWDAVAKLYADPPRTTEQCLHPERLLDRLDSPTPLPFADLPAPEGWTAADTRTLGEMNVQTLLRTQSVEWRRARPAAAGWDGDLLRTYLHTDGRAAIAWATTWDTPEDAAAFLEAYEETLPRKYTSCGPLDDVAEGFTEPAAPGGEPVAADPQRAFRGRRWDCGDGPDSVGWAVQRGREVFVVEGFPATAARATLDALLARTVEHVE